MGRALVSVQRVDEGLHSQFIELWITHRIEGGTTPEAAQRLALDGTLRNALQRNDICAFVAFVDGRPAGYVVLADSTREPARRLARACRSTCSSSTPTSAARASVARCSRPRAATPTARAASTSRAAVPAGDREANRFFARLGFAPETVRRVASAATLQRKLAGEPRPQRVSLDLLQRRRDLRARAPRPRPEDRGLSPVSGAGDAGRQAPGAASRSRQVIRDVQTRLPVLVGDDDVVADERASGAQQRRRAGHDARCARRGGASR